MKKYIGAFFFLVAMAHAQPEPRGVFLEGIEVYSSKRLIKGLRLNRYRRFSKRRVRALRNILRRFYRRRGYRHVRVYVVSYSRRSAYFYIDEGRLNRIVFHNVGALDIIRMRNDFDLKGKVYHRSKVRKQLRKLKKKYKLRRISPRLKRTKNYQKGAHFQIDDIDILPAENTPIAKFKRPLARYELHITVKKYPEKKAGWLYGLRLDFQYGLIPYARYKHPNWLVRGDNLDTTMSLGVFYGLDLTFGEPPRWSWAQAKADYYAKPIINKRITPEVKASVTRTLEDREDIGLERYSDVRFRGTIGPGIQVIEGITIHLAYGAEGIYLYGATLTEEAQLGQEPLTLFVDETGSFRSLTQTAWQVAEASVNLNLKPDSLKYSVRRDLTFGYALFFNSASFNKLFLKAHYEHEFENFDLFILGIDAAALFVNGTDDFNNQTIPFYYEQRVEDNNFKGFLGREFHTRRIARWSSGYRISLYKDVIFGGAFFDMTVFEGSNYNLFGQQYGIVGGVSAHLLFLDQFNVNLYFGQDLLFSDRSSQFNIYLNALLRF